MRFDEALMRIAEIDEVALQPLLDDERTGDDAEAQLLRECDKPLLERIDVLRSADLEIVLLVQLRPSSASSSGGLLEYCELTRLVGS